MFFRGRSDKNKSEVAEELSNCEGTAASLKIIADEKCRQTRIKGISPHWDMFLWSAKECTKASEAVIKQVEQCINLRKGPTG